MLSAYHIYTDGACSGNPGPGWWGVVILQGTTIIATLSNRQKQTTNNAMELEAVIHWLEWVIVQHHWKIDYTSIEDFTFGWSSNEKELGVSIQGVTIYLYTDSKYVQQWVLEWMNDWKSNAWRTSRNKPIAHSQERRKLDMLIAMIGRENISRHRVKGHNGNVYNEMADQLATWMIQ